MKEIVAIMKTSKAYIPLFAGVAVSWVTGGTLTAIVVLIAMLFIAHLLIRFLRQSYPHPSSQITNQRLSPTSQNFQSQSQFANQQQRLETPVITNDSSSAMQRQQTTLFDKPPNSPSLTHSSSMTETQSSGSGWSINPGALDGPSNPNNT